MSNVTSQLSISLDGFVAGPNQSVENPIGEGGMRLHQWAFATDTWHEQHGSDAGERTADSLVAEEVAQGIGAYIMGRKMFGGGDGPWDESWTGWWGEDPPYHTPVYVLCHHEREPLEMQGGTTFHFVTDGIESALEQARKAAGERDISIGGGAQAIQQYLAAGLLEELEISIVPLLLGGGERLLDNLGDAEIELEQLRVVEGVGVTHITYRVVKS